MLSRPIPLLSLLGLLVLVGALGPNVSDSIQRVYASPDTNLLVFAEASSFARLNDIDPSGWFYQAVLYNPTDSDIVVTGLRWWYTAKASVKMVDGSRDVKCYDSRYFSSLPVTNMPNDRNIWWEYAPGSIFITVPAKEIIVTWIEVPPDSVNNDAIGATYYVVAYVDGQWLSSPLYDSHSGHDSAVSTVFRADFNLTTDPNDEQQMPHPPKWLFNEDRSVVAGLSTRVRLIPVTSSRNSLGINYATVNVTLPSGWSYVPGSAYNPYGEAITLDSVDGKDRLKWDLDKNVLRYSSNQSMAQNYIEFNVTAPYIPYIHNFTVNSIITSLNARTTTENQYIYAVVKTPPNATFTSSPTTLPTGEDVTFNATASYDLDGQIVSYFWNFGDGNTGTGNITTHAYADNGTYTVTVTITDNDGLKDVATDVIIVQNRPPIAQFTESAEIVDTGVVIYFNASNSYDLDGYIVNYFWDFGDGTNVTGKTVSHAYVEDGNYTVKLTVTDDDGASAITTDVKIILNRAPVASFVILPQQPIAGEKIIFNASDSYDLDGSILTYTWNFGDGNLTTITSPTVTHTYKTFGNYLVILNVTDNDNQSSSKSKLITNYIPPVAVFEYSPLNVIPNQAVTFDASASYDSDGEIVSYRWDFGDGNITVISSPTINHRYSSFGNYTVTLAVTDNDNFYNSSTLTLTVHNVDIAIVDVIVSANEVYVGQVVNISVVVKNEGTANETFNVTLYYDSTAIGTQTVTDLEPGTETTLKFSWDTTDVTPDVSYTIKAEASTVAWETDTVDNTYTYDTVKVKSQVTSEPFDWTSILPYLIPIILGILGFSVAGILRKKREDGQGFEFFNEMTDGGIPDAYSVMIIGGAGSGKSVLCQQLAYEYLTQGKSCIYVTYDIFPSEVRQNMKNFQWNISTYEQEGAFKFVDAYSSTAGLKSEGEYRVEQPFALSDLGITVSSAMNDMKNKSTRVFLDSTASLFSRLDPPKVIEFLQDRSARIKGDEGVFFFTVGKGTVPSGPISRLEEIVDCIIELDVYEENGKTWKRMRVRKLRGRRVADTWIPFKIEMKKGITLFPPKGWSEKRRD